MADPHTRHTGSITMKRVYVFWWRSEWEDEIPFFDSSTHTHFVSLITLSDFHEFKWNTFIWLLRNPLPKPALPEHVNAFCAIRLISTNDVHTLTSTEWTFLFYYCNFYCGNFFRANDNNNKKRTEYWSTVMWAHFRDYNDDFDWFGLSAKHWKSSSYIRELIIVIVQLFRDKKKMSIPFSPSIKWDFCCFWADLLHQNRLNASMI